MSRPATRIEGGYFERLYRAQGDPWHFATSAYERAKYEATLAALEGRHFERALEVGCSIGVFTALLAPSCDELVAVDISSAALERAAVRLAGAPNIALERRRLPEEMPDGPFDLIVCSEVLYYWSSEVVLEGLAGFERSLEGAGSLLAAHWRRPTSYPLQGDAVHDLLYEHTMLTPAYSVTEINYRLDRFDKPDPSRRRTA